MLSLDPQHAYAPHARDPKSQSRLPVPEVDLFPRFQKNKVRKITVQIIIQK